jgi:hypothetical protein
MPAAPARVRPDADACRSATVALSLRTLEARPGCHTPAGQEVSLMASGSGSAAPPGPPPAFREAAGYPFRGPGRLDRVIPFAAVAVLAEASLVLPPGPQSQPALIVSVLLLLATAAAFGLPWRRLPRWMPVLVPLIYSGSALALILAAGATSGVGMVLLIPVLWTALFHHRWESGCVVAAILVVVTIISLTPVVEPDPVLARRILLWASLGVLISVAVHGLRDRIRHSQEERARLQERLREITVLEDRERIADDLRGKVIQQIFAAGLALQGAASLTTEREVRRRVESSVADLDQAVRLVRQAIFGLEHDEPGRGLRLDVLDLCGRLTPAPEVTFTGRSTARCPPRPERSCWACCTRLWACSTRSLSRPASASPPGRTRVRPWSRPA